ncbi:hypothetical protein [Hyalangium gracile]|uniref:hypothetical protein n=1 Tax=Hyalangium gracile TaxID=394092 RepID=UPI001CCE60AB|nr:hypothetical protein [Hyalangium gracile]
MKRLLSLFLVTLLLSTGARAQTPAPADDSSSSPPSSSEPAAPAEAQPAPPAAAPAPAPAPGEEAAAPAPATAKPDKSSAIPTVAVLSLESNKAAQESAPAIAALIASRLAESPRLKVLTQRDIETMLSTERQRQLLGSGPCSSGTCLEELSNAVGARYVVTGRLDQFGGTYLLTVSLLDTFTGRGLARPRAEASSSEDLLRITEAVGEQLLVELAPEGKTAAARPLLGSARETPGSGLVLGLRINNSFISNLAALNPGGDLEVGYAFHPEWVGFLQIGFSFVRSTEEGQKGSLRVLPSVLGARHYYRLEHSLRPYWGLGLGVQLSFGQFGIFRSTGALPTVMGFFGAEYLIAGRVGFHLEAGTNLAQATLGLTDGGLGDGINLDLTAGVAYHF